MKSQDATHYASRPGLIVSFCSGSDGESSDSYASQLRAANGCSFARSRFPSKTRTKRNPSNEVGFTLVQLLIVVAIMAVLVCVAFVGITKARGRIRLANSAREFASYAEMARANAVRRHAQTSVQQVNGTTYSITMDFSGSGTVTTQNFATQTGVNINMPRTVTFDWRGRTPVETSIGFTNEVGTANVGITGSGDITIDAEIFHDGSIPTTVLTGTGGTVVPDPSPTPSASPSASPSPSPSSSPGASPSPTPVPSPNPSPSQSPTPNPTATPTPNPTPTPTPATSPTPTPTVAPCTFSVSASSITVAENGSATVTAHYNNHTGSGTITATSSNSGQIQVSPGSATVSGTSSASFTITVKKQSGSVTFASSCGSATVTVTVP